jgi:amidase
MAMSPSFDVLGWFAATPGVFRQIGAVLLDEDTNNATVERLIMAADMFAEADREVAELLHRALARMKSALPAAEHMMIAPGGSGEKLDDWREVFRICQAFEIWQTYGDFVQRTRPNFGPGVRERMAFAATVTSHAVEAAQRRRTAISEHIRAIIRPGTVVAAPAAPSIAPRLDISPAEMDVFRARTFRLTCVAGLAGLPQVVIPAGTISGCPVGLSFIGWRGGDEALLDLSVRLSPRIGETLTSA